MLQIMNIYPFLSTLLTLLLSTHFLSAQQKDTRYEGKQVFPFGVVDQIQSKELGEKRWLNVYLPQGYHPDSAVTYPVIYVLDGSAHEDFPHIAGLAQFMNMYNILPKSIVVGIANVDRYRDFTAPSSDKEDLKSMPTSGGSALFIAFLEKELQPYIQKHYKTNGQRTLIGQSMGGLLATEVLFKHPHLFEQYIIVSPSLWWNKQKMIKKAEAFITPIKSPKKVFVSLGKEHPVMHKVAEKLVKSLQKNENIEVFFEPILTEDHATILHKAVYKGFEVLYKADESGSDH